MPGGPVTGGGDVVPTESPPMTISTISVKPSINPIVLFCEYILVQIGQKHVQIYVYDSRAYCIHSTGQDHLRKNSRN